MAADNEAIPLGRTIPLMAGLMMGVLLTLMDQTVVSTALPTIVGQLGGLSLYAWVFTAYMLAQTSFFAIFAKLSDLYGRRLMFLIGLGAFMVGSALCGQARTMEELILFRGLQGAGGAGLMPVALAILGIHYTPQERARLTGILGSVAGLAVVIGPTVGSIIVENLSWRWVFYVNLPFGFLSAILLFLFLRESRDTRVRPAIDYPGAVTLIGWISSLTLAILYSGDLTWTSPVVLGLVGACVLLFVLFLFNEARSPEPILPLRIFNNPTVAVAGAVTLLRSVPFYAPTIFIPLLVQGVMGGTSEDARNAVTALALPSILGSVLAGFLIGRNIGYRSLMVVGLSLNAVGLWLAGQVGMAGSEGELLRDLTLAGFGLGLMNLTLIQAFQNSIAREHMGIASSLTQFLSNLAGTVGMGLLGVYQSGLLASQVKTILASPALGQLPPQISRMLEDAAGLGKVLTSPTAAAQLPPQLMSALRAALETSLHSVFLIAVVFALAALLVSLFMRGSAAELATGAAPGVISGGPANG